MKRVCEEMARRCRRGRRVGRRSRGESAIIVYYTFEMLAILCQSILYGNELILP